MASGTLPSQERSEVLHEVIEDTFGVHEFENNVRIDFRAWERTDRTPDAGMPPRGEEEELLEGEPEENDSYTSQKEGIPADPEDRLVYDKIEPDKPAGS